MGVLLMVMEEGWGGKLFRTGGTWGGSSVRLFGFPGDDKLVDIDKVAGEGGLVVKTFGAEVAPLFGGGNGN